MRPRPLLLMLFIAFFGRAALADSFDGRWKQSPLREDFTVQQWLHECGPAPVSASTGGGEIVTVKEEGDELSFVGAGRVYRTNQCYDQLPTLVRDAHSRDASGRSWQTRCTTPASDPRHALMQTRVTVTSDSHVEIAETGRYEITIKEGRCIADIKRTRTFDLVAAAPATSAAPVVTPEPTHAPEPSKACAAPGEPARLEVRPSRKLLRTGESFTFSATVRDKNGCPTGTATTWSAASESVVVDANGKVTVPPNAKEGAVDLVVSAAGKSAKVVVDVSSPAHYDSLLAQSGLNALGENDNSVVTELATSSLGGSDARASDSGRTRRNIFIGVVGALAAILGVLALVGRARAKKAEAIEREAEERHSRRVRETEERNREKMAKHAEALRAHEESVARAARLTAGAMACPACHREYAPGGSTFCPADGNQLVAVAGHEDMLDGPSGGICPTCKRGFDPGVKVCPQDGEELVPYALRGSASAAPAARGKICPTCGGKFDGNATFCGKDGTALVLLN